MVAPDFLSRTTVEKFTKNVLLLPKIGLIKDKKQF